jgi:hypothetical protein
MYTITQREFLLNSRNSRCKEGSGESATWRSNVIPKMYAPQPRDSTPIYSVTPRLYEDFLIRSSGAIGEKKRGEWRVQAV